MLRPSRPTILLAATCLSLASASPGWTDEGSTVELTGQDAWKGPVEGWLEVGSSGLDSNNRVKPGIEVGWAVENFQSDRIFLQLVHLSAERTFYNVFEESPEASGMREDRTLKNLLQFFTDGSRRDEVGIHSSPFQIMDFATTISQPEFVFGI